MNWTGHVAHMRGKRNSYKILVWICEGKTSLGRCRLKWDDDIKMDLRDMGCGVGWFHLGQIKDQWWCLVNMGKYGNEP